MKYVLLTLLISCLGLSACHHYLDPNASVDGVVGTVGGALGNVGKVGSP
ncbi:MAG: hypothetical protein SOX43_03280 [Pelistega sp.]|nr:hypothetical protein [Pelistega sp.]